ncbi:MAG: sugar-binding domain-containing protein [Ornithinibacter sp.]
MIEIDGLRAPEGVLVSEAVRCYYLEDQSKTEIAAAMGVSRFKVARLLETARTSGMVRIEVLDPSGVDGELSARIRTAFSLRRCIVVSCADSSPAVRSLVGSAGAQVISDVVGADDVLGLPWARTVAAMLRSLTALPPVPVVQLSGSLVIPREDSPVDIVRTVAGLTGADAWVYYSPLVLDDAGSADAMRRQPAVRAAMAQVPRVTVAVVSIGAWSSGQSTIHDALPEEVRADVARHGTVGEALGVFFDADGAVVHPEVSDRMVTITAEQLYGIPEVVALATGAVKARAVRGFLRGGYASSLVVDRSLALALLSLHE